MRQDSGQETGPSVVLASASAGTAGAAPTDGAVALPRLPRYSSLVRAPRVPVALSHPLAGRIALSSMLLGALAVVVFASAQAGPLVPHSSLSFPHWESGPLHHILGRLTGDYYAVGYGFSGILILMSLAYIVALLAVRTMSMRTIAIFIVAIHAILLLGPPLQLTDLFNYLGYARLGAVHHLNPYQHVINAELHDPVFRFSSWHNLRSPYGPLFTLATYPAALLPLPAAYWVLKASAVLASLGFIALVWKCARLLGRDPRFAVLFVAANPVYLMYAVGGFHNDFFMLIPSTAAVALLLARRDRAAGAALMLAVAVKFTAILLLPFLLIAARPPGRRLRVLAGAALAAIPLAAMSIAAFGFTLPNLQDQSTLLTDFSVPNLVGILIGVGGGTPTLLRVGNVLLVVVTVYFLRRNRDWISGAGFSTLALVVSLAWLVPWYVIWVLPLAALGTSVRLRRAAVAFTLFLVIAFMPVTGVFLSDHGIDLMGGSADQASKSLQHKLAG